MPYHLPPAPAPARATSNRAAGYKLLPRGAIPGQGGLYQGLPVMALPQYAAPPPRAQPSFLEGCLAALCCCCLIDECCCDPSIIFVG
ncbi:hypothetical protein ZWY2020_016366 [Hordeum vulgare]|nr:hypothetical protein ZWY2020_016366 [Hordeum vulgare]